MKQAAKIITLIAVACAVLAPTFAEAHPHQVCHVDGHHHRVCHMVK
ncbi:HHHH-motif protein [Paraburkholderia tropica]|nr:HHHH-motif protein [Paraburkholderia tropica]